MHPNREPKPPNTKSGPFQPGLLERVQPLRKVALFKASRIGDFLCAVPAFRALRRALPQAQISLISLPMLEGLVRRCPYVDRYIAFPGYPGLAEQFFEARQAARFFAAMQAERFDLAIQFQGSGVNSNPFTLMLGAHASAGFIRRQDPPGRLDAALPWPNAGHEVERMLALSSFLGAEPAGTATEFPLWPADQAEAQELLEGARPPLIGIHPAARSATRRWALEHFAAAGHELTLESGGTLVLLGEGAERETAQQVITLAGSPALNLAGRTSLPGLGAVLSHLSVLLTNDTGPAHIAYALETPTVTIFGGEDPQRYGALQPGPFHMLVHEVPCRPCDVTVCPVGYRCLEGISVSAVIQAAREVMRPAVELHRQD